MIFPGLENIISLFQFSLISSVNGRPDRALYVRYVKTHQYFLLIPEIELFDYLNIIRLYLYVRGTRRP